MRKRHHWLPVLATAGLLLAMAPSDARAEVEVGVFGGAHLFNPDNELGRRDNAPAANELEHMAIIGLRGAWMFIPRLGIEGELALIPTHSADDRARMNILVYRGHLIFNILTGRFRPFVLAGYGGMSGTSTNLGVLDSDTDPMFHGGAGIKVDIQDNWGLRLDGRILLPPAINGNGVTYDGEILLGIYGRWGHKVEAPKDSDADGILDRADKCPDEAEDVDEFEDEDGCPDPDNDGDGVEDGDDKCPGEAGSADNDGCPAVDSDGDGVFDNADKCPDEAGDKDKDGCPDKDSDGDGILDSADKCPEEKGPEVTGGCPDPDTDGDGLVDRLDKCPSEPETRNNYQDADGCPDEVPEALAKFTGVIKGINFESGSAIITQSSYKILKDALGVLNEFPDVHLEIGGHTDSQGDADYNKRLSQQRADAVKKYFTDKGVDAARLKATGYGPDKPLADNETAAGRRENRRVEFQLIND